MVKDPSRRRLALSDRLIEVIDERQTGETLLDEALKLMKSSEKYGTGAWVDLMSGEWTRYHNVLSVSCCEQFSHGNAY